jgi:hypothetical protein
MFVETRTDAAEVLADVAHEVNCACNRLRNDANTRKVHPTYLTKPQLREHVSELRGMFHLAQMVHGGIDQLPAELVVKYHKVLGEARVALEN